MLNAGFWFALPALALIAAFFILPVAAGLALSLSDFDIYALGNLDYLRFLGLGNYARLIHDPLFWRTLLNTFYFVLVGGPLSVLTSLGAALLINSRLVRFKALFRVVYFLPVMTALVAVTVVWRYIYHPRYGLLNYALGFIGIPPLDWLGDPWLAMPALILMAVWKNFGYNMIIFIAGLQTIPEQIYDSARMDGATRFQQLRYVTLPMLAPTFLFVGILTMIGSFQLFAEPYVMTQGGPGDATLSVVLLMYEHGFRWWNLGYAAAIAFLLFAIMLAGTVVQLRLRREP